MAVEDTCAPSKGRDAIGGAHAPHGSTYEVLVRELMTD